MTACTIRDDVSSMDLDMVCGFIADSYWGKGRSRERILKSFENSVCLGAFVDGRQVGFARAVSDGVFHAYVFDVFVIQPYRGQGIAGALMRALFNHERLRDVTGFMLSTQDAHGLYEKLGFKRVGETARYMVRSRPEPVA